MRRHHTVIGCCLERKAFTRHQAIDSFVARVKDRGCLACLAFFAKAAVEHDRHIALFGEEITHTAHSIRCIDQCVSSDTRICRL